MTIPLETLIDLAHQPHPASDWEKELAAELLAVRMTTDPSRPENRHVTLDERSIHFPTMKPEEFRIEDVPHCLSMICRYNGFVRCFYSVAVHSVMVCELAEALHGKGSDIARCALLHDAVEAYLGDVSRPFKACLPDYRRIEEHVNNVVIEALNLPRDPAIWREVARLDLMALHIESNVLLFHRYPWVQDPDPLWTKSLVARLMMNGDAEWLPREAKALMQRKLREYGYQFSKEQ